MLWDSEHKEDLLRQTLAQDSGKLSQQAEVYSAMHLRSQLADFSDRVNLKWVKVIQWEVEVVDFLEIKLLRALVVRWLSHFHQI